MLLDRIRESTNLIDDYSLITRNESKITELEHINKRIIAVETTIDRVIKIILAFVNISPSVHFDNNNLQKQMILIENDIKQGSYISLQSIIADIQNDFNNKENEMKVIWSDYYKNNFSSLQNTLSLLHKVLGDVEMNKVNMNINKYKIKWPIYKDDITNIEEYKNDAVKIIEDKKLNIEVHNFLINTVSGKSTIKDITEEVRRWILENKLEESIYLSFSK